MSWEDKAIEGAISFFSKVLPSLFRRRKKELSEIMRDSYDVHRIARRLCNNRTGLMVDCAFLCLAFNGAKDGGYTFRSFIAGDWDHVIMKEFNMIRYRRIPIDLEYGFLVKEIIREGVATRTTIMMQDGDLKAKYVSEDWSATKYFNIEKTSEGLWYFMVATRYGSANDLNNALHTHHINLAVKDIMAILDKYRNKS